MTAAGVIAPIVLPSSAGRATAHAGAAWILDGLEITIAGSVTSLLTHSDTLVLTTSEVSSLATVYLLGQLVGALDFGKLSDSLGRRRLFMWTLAIYLVARGCPPPGPPPSPARADRGR